jgi:hypothetical protein
MDPFGQRDQSMDLVAHCLRGQHAKGDIGRYESTLEFLLDAGGHTPPHPRHCSKHARSAREA